MWSQPASRGGRLSTSPLPPLRYAILHEPRAYGRVGVIADRGVAGVRRLSVERREPNSYSVYAPDTGAARGTGNEASMPSLQRTDTGEAQVAAQPAAHLSSRKARLP